MFCFEFDLLLTSFSWQKLYAYGFFKKPSADYEVKSREPSQIIPVPHPQEKQFLQSSFWKSVHTLVSIFLPLKWSNDHFHSPLFLCNDSQTSLLSYSPKCTHSRTLGEERVRESMCSYTRSLAPQWYIHWLPVGSRAGWLQKDRRGRFFIKHSFVLFGILNTYAYVTIQKNFKKRTFKRKFSCLHKNFLTS